MKIFRAAVAVVAGCASWAVGAVHVSSTEGNDLYRLIADKCERHPSAAAAIGKAAEGDVVLLMAEGYPKDRVAVDWAEVRRKKLRVYVEFPAEAPGVTFGEAKTAEWERGVIAWPKGLGGLDFGRIVSPQQCVYLPCVVDEPLVAIARVAGFHAAVYGIPKGAHALLTEIEGGRGLVATTKLSDFVKARYGPAREWGMVWNGILKKLETGVELPAEVPATVRPKYGKGQELGRDAEREAVAAGARWLMKSHLLLPPSRKEEIYGALARGVEVVAGPEDGPEGDGSLGILEGYSSGIGWDGRQKQRAVMRADCQAESAMVLALSSAENARNTAKNLLEYLYRTSALRKGSRNDPKNPAYGLIAWGEGSPAWEVANYGDDNARVLLATILAAAVLKDSSYDKFVLEGLLANLRTTGSKGFRGDRIDMPELEAKGWKHFRDREIVNPSPHFESGLWACYLWAYRATGEDAFLHKAKAGIRATMEKYPAGWRWGDTMERARMLLCLAWMVRVEDTPEHRGWLSQVAGDLMSLQDEQTGAIRDRLGGVGGGHYVIPQSNEAYGTGETPLIQSNEDCASDQLYTSGFALFGLHEAVAATEDGKLKGAADRLAGYLCRIQTASDRPELDGWWFRGFDFKRWDYWGSSADAGWGVWSLEAGWAQAWGVAGMGLREMGKSCWEVTGERDVKGIWEEVKRGMEY